MIIATLDITVTIESSNSVIFVAWEIFTLGPCTVYVAKYTPVALTDNPLFSQILLSNYDSRVAFHCACNSPGGILLPDKM